MSEQIRTPFTGAAATLVVHVAGATLFAAVGEPVPATAQMGVAEQMARVAAAHDTARSVIRDPERRTTFRWVAAPSR